MKTKKEMLIKDVELLRHQAEQIRICLELHNKNGVNNWLEMMEGTVHLLKVYVNESEGEA